MTRQQNVLSKGEINIIRFILKVWSNILRLTNVEHSTAPNILLKTYQLLQILELQQDLKYVIQFASHIFKLALRILVPTWDEHTLLIGPLPAKGGITTKVLCLEVIYKVQNNPSLPLFAQFRRRNISQNSRLTHLFSYRAQHLVYTRYMIFFSVSET